MMREETDEEIVREAIGVAEDEGYTELYQDAIAALDRLVAKRDWPKLVHTQYLVALDERDAALARAEAAEKERDEALEANEAAKQFSYASHRRRAYAAEARCATLEAALREYADPRNWGVEQDPFVHPRVVWIGPGADSPPIPDAPATARAALAAATRPAETGESLDDEAKQRYESDWATPPAEEPWGSMDLLTGGTATPAEKEGTP